LFIVLGEFPFQVGIFNETGDMVGCGGSIISPKYVLTSHHCVDGDHDVLKVYLIVLLFKINLHLSVVKHNKDMCAYKGLITSLIKVLSTFSRSCIFLAETGYATI